MLFLNILKMIFHSIFRNKDYHFILNIVLTGNASNYFQTKKKLAYHHLDLLVHLSPFICVQSLTVFVS